MAFSDIPTEEQVEVFLQTLNRVDIDVYGLGYFTFEWVDRPLDLSALLQVPSMATEQGNRIDPFYGYRHRI